MPSWIMAIWSGLDMKDGTMVALNGQILKPGRSVQVGVLNNCFLIDVEKPFANSKRLFDLCNSPFQPATPQYFKSKRHNP